MRLRADPITLFLLGATTMAEAGLLGTVVSAVIGAGLAAGLAFGAQLLFGATAPASSPSERQSIVKAPAMARLRSYGTVRIGGGQIFAAAAGLFYYRVVAHSDGRIGGVDEHLINDVIVTVDANGLVTAPSQYASHVRIYWRQGEVNPARYTVLQDAFPEWDADHRGHGIHHSLTLFRQGDSETFSERFPALANTTYKQTFRAAVVWDPRRPAQDRDDEATWAWSPNAALCILDYLRHSTGFAMPWSAIEPEIDAWIAAADACDEDVPLKAGGTEKRYRVSGTYSEDERPADVLARLLSACNGRLWMGPNGGLTISVGVWQEPTVTLDDQAIVSYRLDSAGDATEATNIVTAVYTDPAQGYVETEAAPWIDEAAVTAKGEERSDAKLYFAPSHGQTRRLMKQAAGRMFANWDGAPVWRGTVTTNLLGLQALSERFVRLRIAELDLAITVEIDDLQFVVEEGGIITGVAMQVTQVAASMWAWNAATEEGDPPDVAPVIANQPVPLPGNFGVLVVEDGAAIAALGVWDAIESDGGAILNNATKLQMEFRRLGTTAWRRVEPVPASTGSVQTPALPAGQDYEFRARFAGVTRASDYCPVITREIAVDAVAPGTPTGRSVTEDDGDVTVAWTQPASANAYGCRVYRNTVASATGATHLTTRWGGASVPLEAVDTPPTGSYWYYVAAINGSGVESAMTYAGTISI